VREVRVAEHVRATCHQALACTTRAGNIHSTPEVRHSVGRDENTSTFAAIRKSVALKKEDLIGRRRNEESDMA